VAASLLSLTNDLRAAHGLALLQSNPALSAAAAEYARVLAINNWFSHEGPDGSTLSSRAEAGGYVGWTYLAENIYRGFYGDPAVNIIQAWVDSPAHHAAMLSDVATEIGIGCYVLGDFRWCVQDFGAR
jgi:uncharacterized protein YkwD